MRIVLHAGMHKTGTTSFQAFLTDQAAALERAGVRGFATPPQVNAGHPARFDPEWLLRQLSDCQRNGLETVVFSHES